MQFRGRPPVPGIIYNTTMSRPDAALTLALLYGFEGKQEARVASIAVTENSLGAAAFADAVFRFYQLGPIPNSNRVLPIGLAADRPLPPDPPFIKAVLDRTDEKGDPVYRHAMRRVSDTAETSALMRNSLAYFEDGMISAVLSAPATYMARILGYAGSADLIRQKVRTTLVIERKQDVLAMRRMLADWPAPMVFCGKQIGASLLYPGAGMESDFAWTQAHPVVDFYRAYKSMPYDAPMQDPAAVLYAVRPDAGLFRLSGPGTIDVSDDGDMRFTPSASGKHHRLEVVPEKKDEIVETLREIVSAKPVPPPPRRRFTPEELEELRKQREEEQRKRELEERKKAAASK